MTLAHHAHNRRIPHVLTVGSEGSVWYPRPHPQKHHWRSDLVKFNEQLALGGLCIRDIKGDGNCLVRWGGVRCGATWDPQGTFACALLLLLIYKPLPLRGFLTVVL